MVRILVIGESCADVYHYGCCKRICPEAPVPIFNSNDKVITNGGMAHNVYNNLLSLGIDVDLITNENWRSITKTRLVDTRSNYTVLRVDDNDDKYGRCNLNKINYSKYDGVIISDYNKGYLSEEDIEEISNNHDVTFLDTKKPLGNWCQNVKFIKINDIEYEKTKNTLTKEIIKNLIITMGPKGCEYQGVIFPVPKVEIKDAGGAGDTFIAGLAFKYVHTQDAQKAIKFANQCATKVVQKKGIATV